MIKLERSVVICPADADEICATVVLLLNEQFLNYYLLRGFFPGTCSPKIHRANLKEANRFSTYRTKEKTLLPDGRECRQQKLADEILTEAFSAFQEVEHHRSASVGDVLQLDRRFYVIERFGFREVELD